MLIQWWVKSHRDGSCDYVRLRASDQQQLEWAEGSHLPPQMPLLKRRFTVSLEAAEVRQLNLLAMGFRPGQPLF